MRSKSGFANAFDSQIELSFMRVKKKWKKESIKVCRRIELIIWRDNVDLPFGEQKYSLVKRNAPVKSITKSQK